MADRVGSWTWPRQGHGHGQGKAKRCENFSGHVLALYFFNFFKIIFYKHTTPMCKTNLWKHRHTYSCVQICTNVYWRVRAVFWTIFDRTEMKISLYRGAFRVEFDGDVHFFLAPPKSMFLSISINLFDIFSYFLVFQVFLKVLILFSPAPPPSRSFCHRGSHCRGGGRGDFTS